jgi:YesN/AraC family two-component response regulator
MGELAKLKLQAKEYNILCVEDDIILREQIVTFLNKLFKNVYSAGDGVEGVATFQKRSPDIVVSDLSMPNMNGFELVRELKKIKPSVQVIIISAHNDKDTLLNAIHIGICDFVPKPISMSGLQNALEKATLTLDMINSNSGNGNINQSIEEVPIYHKNNAINELMRVKQSGNDIQLINHYHGVPIIHTGYIEKVEEENLYIRTSYAQQIACEYEKNITITSELLAHDIEAEFLRGDHFKSLIVLKNLSFSQSTAKKRQQIRVSVDDDFKTILKSTDSKNKILARTIDISTKAIYLELLEFDEYLKEGDNIEAMITFGKEFINTSTKVYKITKEDINDTKSTLTYKTFVVLFLDLNDENAEILKEYIYKRELELLEEFRSLKL